MFVKFDYSNLHIKRSTQVLICTKEEFADKNLSVVSMYIFKISKFSLREDGRGLRCGYRIIVC